MRQEDNAVTPMGPIALRCGPTRAGHGTVPPVTMVPRTPHRPAAISATASGRTICLGMSGGVENCYHDSYSVGLGDGSAQLAGDCSSRTLRDGPCLSNPPFLRSTARGWGPQAKRYSDIGFRVAE